MVQVAFNFKSQGIENIELFYQGTNDCQNLRYEILIIVDPKYVEISGLAVLNKLNRDQKKSIFSDVK